MDDDRRMPRLRSSSSIRIRSPCIPKKKPDAKKSGASPAFLGDKELNANTVAASTIGHKTFPSKKLSAASPAVGAKSTPHAKKSAASPGFLGPKEPNVKKVGPALYPSSTSSNSSKEIQRRPTKEDVTPSLRSLSIQRSLLFKDKQDTELIRDSTADDNSPEATLLKYLEELSNMKPSLETTSALVQELFSCSDSKFTEAWKEADRGVKRLEEGLRIITEAQKLLRSPKNITIPEEELH